MSDHKTNVYNTLNMNIANENKHIDEQDTIQIQERRKRQVFNNGCHLLFRMPNPSP